jgi:hypothetical protein
MGCGMSQPRRHHGGAVVYSRPHMVPVVMGPRVMPLGHRRGGVMMNRPMPMGRPMGRQMGHPTGRRMGGRRR